jgi:hypothetical protein
MKRGALLLLVTWLPACHKDKTPPAPTPVVSAPSAVAPAPPPPVVVGDRAGRALVRAGDAGVSIGLYVRRDGDAVWALQQPSAGLARMRGTLGADGRVTFAGKGPKADTMELWPRADGSVEMHSQRPDGGPGSVVTLVDAAVFAGRAVKLEGGFTVRLGDIPARAQLKIDDGRLAGFYRYTKSETDLVLSGTVDAAGRFAFEERTAGGVVTGRWAGSFLSRDAAAGVWSSPDGKRELPLAMRSAPTLEALIVPDGGAGVMATLEMRTEEFDAGHGCTNTRTYPVAMGLVPASRNKLVNDHVHGLFGAVDEVSCTGTEEMGPWYSMLGIDVLGQAPGYMSLSVGFSSYTGGMHPMPGGSCELLDTSTGQTVSLLQVLGPAVDKIGDEVTAQLREAGKDGTMPFFVDLDRDSVPINEGNLCYLDAHRLQVQYGQGELAPYAYGPQVVAIDVDPIVPLVPPGPAARALFATRGD